MNDEALPAPPFRLVLFDGVCVFCDRMVRFLIARDAAGRLRFTTLQGRAAAALRERHPQIPLDVDTVVFVDASDGVERVYLRSEAMFRVLAEIQGPWRRLSWLRVLPRWLCDFAYGLFVRVRYRVFGRLDACALPPPEERARFLA